MPVSKAQQKAVAKYESANYDKLLIRIEKNKRQVIKAHAANRDESLNSFVNRAIDETIERDRLK